MVGSSVSLELTAARQKSSPRRPRTELQIRHTVKPVLKDHCHERPPVLKDQIFQAEGPTCQYN